MDLFIYLDRTHIEPENLNKVNRPICQAIAAWVEQNPANMELIKPCNAQAEADNSSSAERPLGIHLSVKRKSALKAPLSFFYDLAKQHKQEFVLGILDKSTGATEEVCYFGFEEGKPDAFEVANYIGL